jgi:flagellar biosynthetic protein FliR
MTPGAEEWLIKAFLAFCRVGACLSLITGFASTRFPARIRLYIAIAITMALLPVVSGHLAGIKSNATAAELAPYILSETSIGALIGLLGRFFFVALQFAGMLTANILGAASGMSLSIEDGEPSTTLADLLTLTAVLMFFITDQHVEVIRALLKSFEVLPVSAGVEIDFSLTQMIRVLNIAFLLSVQVAAPFILYGILVNLLLGVANRMVPQVPLQLVTGPLVLAGGLILLYFLIGPMMMRFIDGFGNWLKLG